MLLSSYCFVPITISNHKPPVPIIELANMNKLCIRMSSTWGSLTSDSVEYGYVFLLCYWWSIFIMILGRKSVRSHYIRNSMISIVHPHSKHIKLDVWEYFITLLINFNFSFSINFSHSGIDSPKKMIDCSSVYICLFCTECTHFPLTCSEKVEKLCRTAATTIPYWFRYTPWFQIHHIFIS